MKVFKKIISLILTAAIMVSMVCVGTVSASAETKLTVDGFYNKNDEYCIRIDGLTSTNMFSLQYYTATAQYFTIAELELKSGSNKYFFQVMYDTIGEKEINTVSLNENGKRVEIELDGRFYANENSDGTYTYGYVIFIPKGSKYIEKITACKTGAVAVGFYNLYSSTYAGLNEIYELKTVTPKFDTAKVNDSKDISSLSISEISNYTYTGKARKPAVTIKDGDYTLVKGTDYTLTYKNCKNIGTATVTITGKGNYTGTKTLTYKIVPKKTTIKVTKKSDIKAKFTWTAVDGAEKYQLYYSTNGGKYKKLATVSGSKTSVTLSGLDFEKNDYKFKIRSYGTDDGTKYYSSFSKAVTVK